MTASKFDDRQTVRPGTLCPGRQWARKMSEIGFLECQKGLPTDRRPEPIPDPAANGIV